MPRVATARPRANPLMMRASCGSDWNSPLTAIRYFSASAGYLPRSTARAESAITSPNPSRRDVMYRSFSMTSYFPHVRSSPPVSFAVRMPRW